MTNKKIVVWDLFGGGCNSIYCALKDDNDFIIYTFDITPSTRTHHYYCDLTQNQSELIEYFNQFPLPDIIVASPLCQSFSCVLNMKGGGTCFWKYNDDKTLLVERSIDEFEKLKNGFTKHFDAKTQLHIKKIGEKCINNTLFLIDYYHPKYFYIENPKWSLMWKYLKLNQKEFIKKYNAKFIQADYGVYGFVLKKPTIFCSNLDLDLKSEKTGYVFAKNYTLYEKNNKTYARLNDDVYEKYKDLGLKREIVKPLKDSRAFVLNFFNSPKNKKESSEMISESSARSKIPSELIKDIFSQFKKKMH